MRLAVACVALIGLGCPADAGGLAYRTIEACLKVEEAQEKVFRTAEEWEAFYRQYAKDPSAVPPVDFGRFMVAAHFDGGGSACVGFTVDDVRFDDGRLEVRSTRHNSPNPCIAVLAYPQLVLEVERRDSPVVFRIRDVQQDPPGAATRSCY